MLGPLADSGLEASPLVQQYYIVRVDAPPGVSTIAADSCPVTIESGPHATLQLALDALQRPRKRAYVLPDIVFLPTNSTVYALNETVPQSKPRLVVSAAAVAAARGPSLPAPRHHAGHSPAARGSQRRGSGGSRDAHATSTPARWQGSSGGLGAAALEGLVGAPGMLPWPQAQLGAQQAAAALGALPLLPLPLGAAAGQAPAALQQPGQPPAQLPLLPLLPLPGQQDALAFPPLPLPQLAPLPPGLLPPLPPFPGQAPAAPPAAVLLATPQQPRLQRRAPHAEDAEAEAEGGEQQQEQQAQLLQQQLSQQQLEPLEQHGSASVAHCPVEQPAVSGGPEGGGPAPAAAAAAELGDAAVQPAGREGSA